MAGPSAGSSRNSACPSSWTTCVSGCGRGASARSRCGNRKIPKPGGAGKVRRLGIPTVADRVVQAAMKLVLEPIFEADFEPVSYRFRPARRAQDAIAEIHVFGTQEYRWVLDADIEACFDRIDHAALLGRVRARVKDKRVLALSVLDEHLHAPWKPGGAMATS